MRNLILYLISFVLIVGAACSDDAGGTITDPFGGGGTGGDGTGNVTISVSFKGDQQGGGIFSGTPSVAIKVSKITASIPAQQYTESLQFDGTTVVNANVSEDFIQYQANSGIASGQQWTFLFEGTLASNNQAYSVTSNFVIP